jgi:hypothetical protein
MYIQRKIEAMGGGGGGRRRGGGGGGNGLELLCGVAHEDCPDPTNDSYCHRTAFHPGKHKCESCGRSFLK